MKNTTEIQAALEATLAELKPLQDQLLAEDARSQAGILLAQITLILQRIQHGIPSNRDAFVSVLQAAQLTEPNPETVEKESG